MKMVLQRLGVENPDYKSPGPPGWGLNVGLTTPLRKTLIVMEPISNDSRSDSMVLKAANREEWSVDVPEAKALHGL
jgi:hypothetical protein